MSKEMSADGKSFAAGLVWNYISLIFMAIGGLCFSLLIGIFYDAKALGYFNTFYALYIGMSQIAVFGNHSAVTKKVSENPCDIGRAKSILLDSFVIIALIAVAMNLIIRLVIAAGNGGLFFVKPIEINAMLFGVLLFALNKVVLGYLNGLSRMKEYAVFQSLRNIFISAFIVMFSLMGAPREYLVMSFLCAEGLLFLCEMPSLLKSYDKSSAPGSIADKRGITIAKSDIREIFIFGCNIFPGNFVLELNSKADVLCLSFMTGDERLVGIYSFAALFAEGFYNVFVVIRRSINPKITRAYMEGKFVEMYDKVRRIIRKFGYLAGLICGILVMFVHWVGCGILKDASYRDGIPSLAIISAAIIINMRSIIWGNALSQTGFPKEESAVNILTILSNILMNLLFIWLFGMIGAAIGTAISYFMFALIQKALFKKSKLIG